MIQEECGKIVRQMKHCRQCRADAIGLLKEDKSKYFYRKPLRFAVASRDRKIVNEHFGHAREFHIYDLIDDRIIFIESRSVDAYCMGPDECEDRDRLSSIIEMIRDCKAVLCSRIGPDPLNRLLNTGIKPVQSYDLIENSIRKAAESLF
jgi:predicted Fe-Mo cluster-binding NifX family protein